MELEVIKLEAFSLSGVTHVPQGAKEVTLYSLFNGQPVSLTYKDTGRTELWTNRGEYLKDPETFRIFELVRMKRGTS